MLNHTTGATCFGGLRTIDGLMHPTYKDACKALGLLEDDAEWEIALEEVSEFGSARQVRATFSILLHFCNPTEPLKLYEKFKVSMSDDLVYSETKRTGTQGGDVDMIWIFNQVLLNLDDQLSQMGTSLSAFQEMPQPKELTQDEKLARTFADEYFDHSTMRSIVEKLQPNLNVGQANLCEELYQAVHGEGNSKAFIVSSPGGFGKTFAFQVLGAKVRSEGGIVLNVATTGLAAQNFLGGRTAHSHFKIPIPIQDNSTCSIKAQSDLAKLIKETKLIIWMKYSLAIDITLRLLTEHFRT